MRRMAPLTPATALIWRQWRETRVALRMAFAVNAAMAVALVPMQLSGNWMPAEELAETVRYIWTLSLFGGMLVVLFSHSEKRRITTALNREIFQMPVGTGVLAALLVGYRVFALIALTSATALCIAALTYYPAGGLGDGERIRWAGEAMTAEVFGAVLLSTLAAYAAFQAIEWTLRRFSHVLAWAAIFAPPLLINTVVDESWRGHPLVHGLTIAIGLPIALWAVRAERLGLWDRIRLRTEGRGRGAAMAPFRSPIAAQRWFEYRRAGCWLQRSALTGLAAAVGLTLYFAATDPRQAAASAMGPVEMYFVTAIAYVLLCALLSGIAATVLRYRDRQTGAAALSFTMPISTLNLARAGWLMTARTALLIVVAAVAAAAALPVYLSRLPGLDDAALPFTSFAAHGLLIAFAVWSLYQFGAGMFAAFGLLFLPMLPLFAILDETGMQTVLAVGYPIAVALLIAGGAVYAYRREGLSPRHAAAFAAALPLAAAACLVMLTIDRGGHSQTIAYSPSIWAFYTLAAAAPLAVAPAYLSWLRTQ